MNNPSFAIITPSYAPDFERCRLLCETVEQFVKPPVNHYIIVDRSDLALFQQLQKPRVQILTKEELLPKWIKRLPLRQNIWFSFKTLPIRGWLLQQIIKLEAARTIPEDVAIFVDSDVAFVRPVDFSCFTRNGLVRLYHEADGNFADMPMHVKWHRTSSELVGIPPVPMPAPDYIEQVVTWKRDNVVKLCERIEAVSGRSWIETLSNVWHLSEYTLYGTFVDRVLQDQSGHYQDAGKLCLDYWTPEPMSAEQIQSFLQQLRPEHMAVMISAKAGMPVDSYRSAIMKVVQYQ
ncbi:DUF6492 family protein [Leptolyngbya ohadii]|uniref:DUF6492 family protein n=1 Tax=Leptolyngbya ohadii TaxID=1962290 RepID=UPI000B599D67|nr:DUF6492 family protein [Leptolyngbya ohadii]